jgi:hypothetical protein
MIPTPNKTAATIMKMTDASWKRVDIACPFQLLSMLANPR